MLGVLWNNPIFVYYFLFMCPLRPGGGGLNAFFCGFGRLPLLNTFPQDLLQYQEFSNFKLVMVPENQRKYVWWDYGRKYNASIKSYNSIATISYIFGKFFLLCRAERNEWMPQRFFSEKNHFCIKQIHFLKPKNTSFTLSPIS